MKTIQLSSFILLLLTISTCQKNTSSTGNSAKQNFTGIYRGILPCKDCEGLQTEIKLDANEHFEFSQKTIGKDTSILNDHGTYKWSSKENKIILKGKSADPITWQLAVDDGNMNKLNDAGQKFPDDSTGQYRLLKELNADQRITGKYWKLIELYGQEIIVTDKHVREPYLILKNDQHSLNGHGGCNAFVGFYQIQERNRIKFGTMAATMKACFRDTIESNYMKVFEKTDNYTIKNDTFSLNKARMAPLAKFKAVYLY